jgi:hypothetical protein
MPFNRMINFAKNYYSFVMLKAFRLLFLCCILLFQGCEDDEICIEALSSRLHVEIKPALSTSVFGINSVAVAETNGSDIEVVAGSPTSFKVLLPLQKTTATFKIDLLFASTDPNQTKSPITEFLTINYTTKNQYISKACGFKTKYENLNYTTTGELLVNEPKTTINNENETHLTLQY